MSETVELFLSERELRKLENLVKSRAWYQEKRKGPLHQAEASFLFELADKLERARLRV